MNGIWTEGPKFLRKGLKKRRAEIADLQARLHETEDAEEKRVLEERLQELREQYDPGDREIDGSLFFAK